MKKIGNIEYIAEQVHERRCKKTWNKYKEIELFDSIDSLVPEEFTLLLDILKYGGYKVDRRLSKNELIKIFQSEKDLDIFLKIGIKIII